MRCLAITVLVVLGLLMAPGCARTRNVEFHVVDARSLQPLPGVRLDHFDSGSATPAERRSHQAYEPTAADGVVRVRLRGGYSHSLDFSKDDYHRSSAVVRPDLRQVGIAAPAGIHDTATPRQVPLGTRVVVPMYRILPD